MESKKTVLITGCSSGFGFKTALKFARHGYTTFASVRNLTSEGAKELKNIANEEKLLINLIPLDVTNNISVTMAVRTVKDQTGRVDILINNAGFGYLGALEEFTIEEMQKQYDTNIFGIMRMIKQVLPIMRDQKSGTIINMSSINGIIPFPLWSVYSSSKFALETLSEGLRFEVAPFGIRVALIEPGSFLTNFGKNVKYPAAMKQKSSPYKPLTDRFFAAYFDAGEKARKSFLKKFIDPDKVVTTVYTVSQQSNPKLRNVVGIDSHIYIFLKSVLPSSLWNYFLRKIYAW